MSRKKPERISLDSESFIGVEGRTSKKVTIANCDGIITIRNCGPAKIFVNVTYEAKNNTNS